jgi:hypothetical protein
MQLLLWYTLIDWLSVFCMARIMYRGGIDPWNQYCSSSLSVSDMKRKTSYAIRKGEKQVQILDGY